MTDYEIQSVVSDYATSMADVTEFWITISFGVLVAMTYLPKVADSKYVRLLSMGYLISSMAFIAIRVGYHIQVAGLLQQSENLGLMEPGRVITSLGSLAMTALMVVGTFAVLMYVRHASGTKNDT